MKVYKKVRQLKDGNLYPLFIDKTKPFVFGEWMRCEFHPTKGFAERSIGQDENGNEMGGWHCTLEMNAPHIADELKSGEKRVWMECEAKGKMKKYERPLLQGGTWLLVEYLKPLRILSDENVNNILESKSNYEVVV